MKPNARVLWLIALAAIGCDDSNANPEPDDTTINTSHGGKSSSDASSGKGGSSSGSAGKSSAADGGRTSAGSAGAGPKTNASGDDAGTSLPAKPTSSDDCKAGVQQCFCGAPSKDADFLNQCTAATCNPFDNSKLKKRNADGSLPPIP